MPGLPTDGWAARLTQAWYTVVQRAVDGLDHYARYSEVDEPQAAP